MVPHEVHESDFMLSTHSRLFPDCDEPMDYQTTGIGSQVRRNHSAEGRSVYAVRGWNSAWES
jgi:hypothetical protein